MNYYRSLRTVTILSILSILIACSAVRTAAKKSDLVVQTHMSSTIMLEPVADEYKTVYLQLRNTSDQQALNYQQPVAEAIAAKGYRVVADPEQAHYWIQANILQISRTDLRSLNHRDDQGYGAAIQGAEIGSLFGDGDGKTAAIVVGGLIGILTDALVEDVSFVMITDLQISEKVKPNVIVNETTNTTLDQGSSGKTEQTSATIVERKKYQTRITSTANQVNLTFQQAQVRLLEGLIQSMSGLL